MELRSSVAAVITGSASGLGEATARALAARGVKVALFDMNAERGEAIARESGGIFCQCNVTDEASVDAAFAKARAAHGQERILINCAGTAIATRTVSKGRAHPLDSFERIIQINLIGTFRCLAKSAAGMAALDPLNRDGERGVIVNTASAAAYDGQIGQAAYAASKGGVVGMTLPIARDLSDLGIRICAIAPGLFDTALMSSFPEEIRAALAANVPFPKRLGNPAEFAALALQICENGMMNGETIRLDGAIRMAPR